MSALNIHVSACVQVCVSILTVYFLTCEKYIVIISISIYLV